MRETGLLGCVTEEGTTLSGHIFPIIQPTILFAELSLPQTKIRPKTVEQWSEHIKKHNFELHTLENLMIFLFFGVSCLIKGTTRDKL